MIDTTRHIKEHKLDTVEEYYEYMSQANTFAPKFELLSGEAKARWIQEYEEQLEGKSLK